MGERICVDFLKMRIRRIFMHNSLDKSVCSDIIRVYLITNREYYSLGGRIYE